jgi:regulator of replication initiation timing
MLESALDMHDALLLNAPAGARHDADVCVFCTDFAMTDEGIPSGLARLELADAKSPYGSVTYADPGYQADKVKRYPIDTEAHARAAWSYIHQAKNAAAYSADQLSTMRTKIAAALKKFGVEAEKKANEANAPKTPAKPAAKKGEKAEVESPDLVTDDSSGTQSATGTTKPDAAVRGGTKHMETDTVEMISKETHEALLDKALKDGTAALTTERDDLAKQVTDLTAQLSAKTEELASATTENERINGELDTAQVALKAAQDEAEALKADAAAKAEEAAKAEIASARTAQVRNLSLFTEEFITERASRWAEMDEAAWTERLDEWKVAKGQTPGTSTTNSTTETASAITGTRDTQSGQQPSARRAALGLPAQ